MGLMTSNPRFVLPISVALLAATCQPVNAANQPPPGFAALFNNQDLSGWWGAETENPRKYMALPPEEFKKKHDDSLDDIKSHWRVENGELINDGKGLYLTTD